MKHAAGRSFWWTSLLSASLVLLPSLLSVTHGQPRRAATQQQTHTSIPGFIPKLFNYNLNQLGILRGSEERTNPPGISGWPKGTGEPQGTLQTERPTQGGAAGETSPKSLRARALEHLEADRPPSSLAPRRENLRNIPEFQEFSEAVNVPTATAQEIEMALQKLKTKRDERDVTDAVGQVVADAMKAGTVVSEALNTSTPSLFVRHPADERWKPLVNYLKENELKPVLSLDVVNTDIVLLPFVYSSDGKALLANIRRRHPRQILSEKIADQLETWDSATKSSRENVIRTLRGKVVYVIGHVPEESAQQAFERRHSNGRQTHIPLSSIERAATEVGFGFLPLGCDTALSSAIGTVTRITDVDALNGVSRALEGPFTNWEGLLSATSDQHLALALDLSGIDSKRGRIALAELDKDKEVHSQFYAHALMNPPRLAPTVDNCVPNVVSPCVTAPLLQPPLQ
jgi:hypothetical protein